jgi:hypothetical protein
VTTFEDIRFKKNIILGRMQIRTNSDMPEIPAKLPCPFFGLSDEQRAKYLQELKLPAASCRESLIVKVMLFILIAR